MTRGTKKALEQKAIKSETGKGGKDRRGAGANKKETNDKEARCMRCGGQGEEEKEEVTIRRVFQVKERAELREEVERGAGSKSLVGVT